MPRILLTLLAVLISLQSAWAAVSSYCGHEGEKTRWHFGHHTPAKEAVDLRGDQDNASDPSSLTSDLDCGQCHLGHCHFVGIAATDDFKPTPGDLSLAASPVLLQLSSLPERPERPKWVALA